jgi:hypothetical protein
LNQIVQRLEDLKTISISANGVIEDGQGQHLDKEKAAQKKRKIFAQKVFIDRESLLTT